MNGLGARKDRIGTGSKEWTDFKQISYFDPSIAQWTKFKNTMAQRTRNMSAIQGNPNMANYRLGTGEKFFQKFQFFEISKLESVGDG